MTVQCEGNTIPPRARSFEGALQKDRDCSAEKATNKKEKEEERAGVRTRRNAALSRLVTKVALARLARVRRFVCKFLTKSSMNFANKSEMQMQKYSCVQFPSLCGHQKERCKELERRTCWVAVQTDPWRSINLRVEG